MKVFILAVLGLVCWVGVASAQCCPESPYSLWLGQPTTNGPPDSWNRAYSDSLGNMGVISKSGPFLNVFPAPPVHQFRGGMDLGREADRLTDFLNDQYQMDHGVTPWGTVSKDPWGFRMQRER